MGRTALKAEVLNAPKFRALADLRELEDTALVSAYLGGETRTFDVLVERGEIQDAKTALGLLFAAGFRVGV